MSEFPEEKLIIEMDLNEMKKKKREIKFLKR